MTRMKQTILLFSFVLIAACGVKEQTFTPPKDFDPNRDPKADLAAAVKVAQETNKTIILDVGGEWCIWCHRIDHFIETNTKLKDYLSEKFIVIKVNYSDENKNEEFLSQYPDVPGYPHFFVLDKNGKFLHSQGTAELESGESYDLDKFLIFLQTWAPKT